MKSIPVILFLLFAVVVSFQEIPRSFEFKNSSIKFKLSKKIKNKIYTNYNSRKNNKNRYSSILENAYYSNSYAELKDYFEKKVDFQKNYYEKYDLTKIREPFLFIKYIYQIFEDFYTPKHLSRIGNYEWGPNLYSHIKYAFIQNEILIFFYDTLSVGSIYQNDKYITKLCISDFRPNVKIPGVKTIFLDLNVKTEINDFLDNSFSVIDENLMSPAFPTGESEKRLNFINEYVMIFPGHWGSYWQIETYPEISISFNKDFSKARIDFRVVYEGGEAYYERTGNKWNLIKSEITWIE